VLSERNFPSGDGVAAFMRRPVSPHPSHSDDATPACVGRGLEDLVIVGAEFEIPGRCIHVHSAAMREYSDRRGAYGGGIDGQ
jgi:hypothetical protein